VVPTQIAGLNGSAYVYETPFDPLQQVALVIGEVQGRENVPVRIYREQPLKDILARVGGEGDPLSRAFEEIQERGRCGVVIVLRKGNVLEAASEGMDVPQPVAVNGRGGERHGSAVKRLTTWREVGVGAQILRDLGVRSIALISSSSHHFVGLGGYGIEIAETIQI